MKNLLGKIKLMIPAVASFIMPTIVKAAEPPITGPDIAGWKIDPQKTGNISSIIVTGVNIFLSIVGILTLVYLVYGGVLYITAGGDAEKAASGKNAVIHAIIGIVIIAAAYIIFGFARGIGTGDTTDLFQR